MGLTFWGLTCVAQIQNWTQSKYFLFQRRKREKQEMTIMDLHNNGQQRVQDRSVPEN